MSEGRKKRAIQFENNIKSFLSRLEFKDVEGAKDNFLINGVQVDVVAGHEDSLLIVECTMKQELGTKSVRDKIKELRGIIATIEDGFRQDQTYKKYKKYFYILAVKNINVRREDYEFANGRPRIYIWDDNFVEYYEDLYNKIRHYAKYNLLGEIGVRPEKQSKIIVPAFRTKYKKMEMFNFLINPRDLLAVSYVARRETKNERYYQRIINKKKINSIAQYIDKGKILPNNLIIAFGDNIIDYVKFQEIQKYNAVGIFGDITYGMLEFPSDYRSCWIIDGQHRLYGCINTKTAQIFSLPITAFKGISLQKQCEIFLDINKNQKPVPADLVWDLNGDMLPDEEEGVISNTVKILNIEGPLRHHIYVPSLGFKKGDKLKIAGICSTLQRAKLATPTTTQRIENPFYDPIPGETVRKLSKALIVYFSYLQRLLAKEWELGSKGFILDDGGNSVIVKLFERIISYASHKRANIEECYKQLLPHLKSYLDPIYGRAAISSLKQRITSEATKDRLVDEIVLHISRESGNNEFGANIVPPTIKMTKLLEERLKEFIKNILLKEIGGGWFDSSNIPSDIRGQAYGRLKGKKISDSSLAYTQMTLGECINIIKSNKQVFLSYFIRGESGFNDEKELDIAFTYISKMRSAKVHSGQLKISSHDEKLFEIYMEKLNCCIEPIIVDAAAEAEEDQD